MERTKMSIFQTLLKLAKENAEENDYYNYYEEEWPSLSDEEKVRAYFEYNEPLEIAEELNIPIYNGKLQLSDRHVLFDINGLDEDDFESGIYAKRVENALTDFEEENNVEEGVWQDGRSGRHIVIEPTYNNILRFDELQAKYKEAENKFINEINNGYEEVEESLQVKTEWYDPKKCANCGTEVPEGKGYIILGKTYCDECGPDEEDKLLQQEEDRFNYEQDTENYFGDNYNESFKIIKEKENKEVPYDNTTEKKCPRCGQIYTQYPALSRRDNKTYICPDCGTEEAMEDYFASLKRNKNESRDKVAETIGKFIYDLGDDAWSYGGESKTFKGYKIYKVYKNGKAEISNDELIKKVLNKYPELELVTGWRTDGDVINFKTKEVMNESKELTLEAFGLSLTDMRVEDGMLKVKINGKEYGYQHETMTPEQLKDKFDAIAKHSEGRAFAWLKAHSKLVSSGKKKEESLELLKESVENSSIFSMIKDKFEEIKKEKNISNDILLDNGAIYYMNGNDGTDFDWQANGRTCEFMVFYKETERGMAKLSVFTDGSIEGYFWPDLGNGEGQEIKAGKISEEDAQLFVASLYKQTDDKSIYDKKITGVEDNDGDVWYHWIDSNEDEDDEWEDYDPYEDEEDEEDLDESLKIKTENKNIKLEHNEGNMVEIYHFNNRLNEVRDMIDRAFDNGNEVLMEKYLSLIGTMMNKYKK